MLIFIQPLSGDSRDTEKFPIWAEEINRNHFNTKPSFLRQFWYGLEFFFYQIPAVSPAFEFGESVCDFFCPPKP
jgi:hypothetical protein